MATALCEKSDVEMIWSVYGVVVRIDDNDASSSAARANAMIEKASADVLVYLLQTYALASIQASTWVKWCTAVFAACDIGRRRGNAPPEALVAEYNRYLELLKLIQSGAMGLPGDDGLVAPRFDNVPMVSNLRVDTRFGAAIRRLPVTSTQTPQAPSRKGYDAQNRFIYW